MAKSFQEIFDEIKSNVSVSKSGKKIKTFSRADFDRLAKAFMNTPDYKTDVVVVKDGAVTTKEVRPVEGIRNMIRIILQDFGVDKQEAEKIMTNAYEIRNVDGLYEFVSELITVNLAADKKFDFLPKMDFIGSIAIKDVEEIIGEYTVIGSETGEKIKIKKKAHKLLEKKSKCPKWLKEKVKTKK